MAMAIVPAPSKTLTKWQRAAQENKKGELASEICRQATGGNV